MSFLCSTTTYCIFGTGESYDGEYNTSGTYDSYDYYTGNTSPIHYIYYSTTGDTWCLSTSLGGDCLQFGPSNIGSLCPDLYDGFFSSGACPTTTTTTTSPCNIFDFEAYFDCLVPTTTTTTTLAPTTTTTTTLPPDPCSGVSMSVSAYSYTTTTTTIPVTTTTTTVVYNCSLSGSVQFNIFDEYMRCGNTKKFVDCYTGFEYFSSDLVLTTSGTSPTQNYVYSGSVNGIVSCIVFEGLVDNISGIDTIVLLNEIGSVQDGSCLDCVPPPPPPPPPCDCYVLFAGYAVEGAVFNIVNCETSTTQEYVLSRGATGYTCSIGTPTIVSGLLAEVLINSGSCETVDCVPPPTPPPVPCELLYYDIYNGTPISQIIYYSDCGPFKQISISVGPYSHACVASDVLPSPLNTNPSILINEIPGPCPP